jgi:septal ring factor EnvC (AmiA/AmiB activator)
MSNSPREAALRSLDEVQKEWEQVRQQIVDGKAELATAKALLASTRAELDKATAQLKERRREHDEVAASLAVINGLKAEILRKIDGPKRSFLEGMGRQ